MEAFGITDRGRKRERNEDSILMNTAMNLFIVADGMGGHVHGEVASQTAVRTISDFVEEHMGADRTRREDPVVLLKEAISTANRGIRECLRRTQADIMGTTVSLLHIKEGKAYIAHVGDSGVFRLRKGNLEKLTKDHTRAQELVDAGLLPEEEAGNHPGSHILTRALGPSDSVIPVIEPLDIRTGDSFFLSTDGLLRVLGVDDVRKVLTRGLSVEEKSRVLVEKALEKGAPDNVSVILVEPRWKGLLGRIFSRR